MAIIPSATNCSVASCPVDLGPTCPAPLVGPLDSTGFPVGCKSACNANLDGNPGELRCVALQPRPVSFNSLRELDQLLYRRVQHPGDVHALGRRFLLVLQCVARFFNLLTHSQPPTEGNCPNAYTYAFDENSGSSLWTCDSSLNSDYTLTFCPCAVLPHLLSPLSYCTTQTCGRESRARAHLRRPVYADPGRDCRLYRSRYVRVASHRDAPAFLCPLLAATPTSSSDASAASTASTPDSSDNPNFTTPSGTRRADVAVTSWVFLCAVAGWVLVH